MMGLKGSTLNFNDMWFSPYTFFVKFFRIILVNEQLPAGLSLGYDFHNKEGKKVFWQYVYYLLLPMSDSPCKWVNMTMAWPFDRNSPGYWWK